MARQTTRSEPPGLTVLGKCDFKIKNSVNKTDLSGVKHKFLARGKTASVKRVDKVGKVNSLISGLCKRRNCL